MYSDILSAFQVKIEDKCKKGVEMSLQNLGVYSKFPTSTKRVYLPGI